MDEDTGCLRDALGHLNVSQRWVMDDPELQGRDDKDIVRWARENGHVIITFNARDYWRERRGFHLHECPGIIVLAMANNGIEAGPAARLIANFIMQVGHKVPVDWWRQTKIKVTGEHYLLRRSVAGQVREYKVYEASNAALCFREQRRR